MIVDVSIIIVNYNTGRLLLNCIRSIKEKTHGLSYEIVVVDNASSDRSGELAHSANHDVTVVNCAENLGYGRGNNRGMEEATGKYLFLLNPDTILLNNAVKIMFDYMEIPENRRIAVCGAALYNEKHAPAVSFGKFPSLCSMIWYSLPVPLKCRGNAGLVIHDAAKPFIIDYVTGADFFVRRNVLERTGCFDDNYFTYYEESDLSKRISGLGYQSVIVPSAAIMHLEGKSFKNSRKRKNLMYESSLYYLHKFHRKSPLFKVYCLVNEVKYKIYRLVSPAADFSLWTQMISASKKYRIKNNA